MDPSHLNGAQSRAQKIKDELKTLDLDHLQSFLEGINDPEPPNYRKVNGIIEPPLLKVTLKESATSYQVGNVDFASANHIRAVTLVVNNGQAEIEVHDPLPKNPENPLSIPILDAVVLDLFPLWDAKHKAIKHRMTQINDVRAYAHNCPNQPELRLTYGKNISKLMSAGNVDNSSTSSTTRKRTNGEAVSRHPANKRKRIGLDSIPDSTKSQLFERLIPNQFKVELYNAVARSAFPDFDNVLMAAWNVVSLYEHVGTEFGQLHHSITELKGVLVGLDISYRKERVAENNIKREAPNKAEQRPPGKESGPGSRDAPPISSNLETQVPTGTSEEQQSPSEGNYIQGSSNRPTSPQSLFVAEDQNSFTKHGRSHPPLPIPRKEAASTYRSISEDTTTELGPRSSSNVSHMRDLSSADEIKKHEYMAKIRAARGQLQKLETSTGLRSAARTNTVNLDERKGRSIGGDRREQDLPLAQWGLGEDGAFSETIASNVTQQSKYIHLGNSKLGRPKVGSGGTAPEAPMAHTLTNSNRNANSSKRD